MREVKQRMKKDLVFWMMLSRNDEYDMNDKDLRRLRREWSDRSLCTMIRLIPRIRHPGTSTIRDRPQGDKDKLCALLWLERERLTGWCKQLELVELDRSVRLKNAVRLQNLFPVRECNV